MAQNRGLAVATINLLNLQVPGGLTYEDEPDIPDTDEGRDVYARRIDWLARAVERVDADVIAFQELWSADALDDVFAAVRDSGGYDLVARDAPGRSQPQVALAVRRNADGSPRLLPGADWIPAFPDGFRLRGIRELHGAKEGISVSIDAFSRPVLRAVLQPDGGGPAPPEVTVFACHLKSKGPTRLAPTSDDGRDLLDAHFGIASSAVSHIRRVLEAGALRALLDAEMKSSESDALSPTIVLGDLNDGTLSVSTELLSGQPGYRLFAASRAGSASDKGLYTVETLQKYRSQRDVYYTYIFRNQMESLDHILVSEEFYDHSRKRQWSFRELEVYNDHLNTAEKARAKEVGSSDHGIVRAAFDWNPVAAAVARTTLVRAG